jgi:hypothetical protein
MVALGAVILSLLALQNGVSANTAPPSIWHLHLALSSDPSRMYIQWTTTGPQPAVVAWGTSPASLPSTFTGNTWSFTDSQARTYYFANASMTGLSPGATYFYKVGDGASNWSPVKSFTATRSREQYTAENPLKVAWLGDLGYTNGQATPFLLAAAAAKEFDHFTHVGDYACEYLFPSTPVSPIYCILPLFLRLPHNTTPTTDDLPSSNGTVGDMFESSIEGITSTTAYMGGEGNHEGGGAFGHYANRFAVYAGDNTSGATPDIAGLVPAPYNNHWYSYEVGLVHFVSMSSEAYFFYQGAEAQYAWMDADLSAVDRSATPWVVVYGHRSIYCSCDGDCDGAATTLRDGINGQYGMEALLNKHKVDLWINAQ